MRLLVLLGMALAFGGCSNVVVSYEPLFTMDRAAATSIRPGVWASPEPGCTFNPHQLMQRWPDCANAGLFGPGSFSKDEALASGETMIQQSRFGKDSGRPYYSFVALKAVSKDHRARAVELEVWVVECGPPSPTDDAKTGRLTKSLLPGLERDGQNCRATSAKAVRDAADATRAWATTQKLRWIRGQKLFDRDADRTSLSVDLLGFKKKDEAPAAPAA